MKIVSADITGSLIVNGVDVTANVVSSSIFSGSIAGRVTNLEAFSSSLDATFATDASVTASILVLSQSVQNSQAALSSSYTLTSGSYVITSGSYAITSASFAQTSASLSIRTGNLEATSSTLTSASSSFAAQSASLSTRLTTDETNITTLTNASASFAVVSSSFSSTSGSLSTRVTNLEATSSTVSSSFASTSGSIAGRVTLIEGQYATTGSNTFTGPQYVNQASNAISFTSTASLYTDGGLRVTKDSFVSGTAYFNNVIVYGTASIQYVTSSQVNVGTNIITVNTDTPAIRFGGLSVFDSGSTQLTGSILWDSEKNNWIYSNPSGSTYNSGMLMNGPKNTGSLGTEQGTLNNYITKGQGGDHITSSQIIDDGTTVQIPGNLQVTGSISGSSAVYSGTIIASNGTASTSTSTGALVVTGGVGIGGSVYATNGLLIGNGGATATTNYLPKFTGTSTIGNSQIFDNGTNVGIGTASPLNRLFVTAATAGDYAAFIENTNSTNGYGLVARTAHTGASAYAFAARAGATDIFVVRGDGRVGIGNTSPSYLLDVSGTANFTGALSGTSATFSGEVSAVTRFRINPSTQTNQIFGDGTAFSTSLASDLGIRNDSGRIIFASGGSTVQMLLNTSGNLGLGVTPSAWNGIYRVFQIDGGSISSSPSYNNISIAANVFYNAGNSPRYIVNEYATLYAQDDGIHAWLTAPSGTAGNAITFTQAMTLNSSGRLLVGTSITDNGALIQTSGDIRADYTSSIYLQINGGATGDYRKGFSGINQQTGVARGLHIFNYDPDSSQGIKFFGGTYAAKVRFGGFDSGGNFFVNSTDSAEGYKFYVNGTLGVTGAATFSSSVTANSHIYAVNAAISFGGSGSAPSTDPAIYRIGGLNDLAFAIGSTERMRITSGGNVLIGTTTDDTVNKLQVNGNIRYNGTATLRSQSTTVGTSSTQVSTGTNLGLAGFYNVAWYNNIGGAQGCAILMARGTTVVTVSISDNSGLGVAFTASSGTIFATTTSGTVTMVVSQVNL